MRFDRPAARALAIPTMPRILPIHPNLAPKLTRCLSLSAVQGPTDPPLDKRTLPHYFDSAILKPHAERPALICRSERPRGHGGPPSRNMGITRHLAWDFDQFERHISALTRGLVGMGVKKGDRVAVIMGNNRFVAHVRPPSRR